MFNMLTDNENEKITPCHKNSNWSWHNFDDSIGGGFLVNAEGNIVLEYAESSKGIEYFRYGRRFASQKWKQTKFTLDKFMKFAERRFVRA